MKMFILECLRQAVISVLTGIDMGCDFRVCLFYGRGRHIVCPHTLTKCVWKFYKIMGTEILGETL